MPHPDNQALTTSPDGLALIEQFEGFEPDWYDDVVGVRTIAYGWTGALPDGYEPPLSREEGRALLRETIGSYEAAVRDLVSVPLAQPQFDALVSFTYNLGRSSLATSTLLDKLNTGQDGVGDEFERWVFAGGQRLGGLVRRRAAERALFESLALTPVEEPQEPESEPAGATDDAPSDGPGLRRSDTLEPLDPLPPEFLDLD